ncbi:hypothetical protein Tco_0795428 [Tanacetum coccineum]
MPSLPPLEPTVSYFDDLDFFKDFENEFPAIVYNDALTSKSDFSTEPVVIPQHIDEFDLKDETSLSECDEEINDDDKIDIKHSSGDLSVKPLPDVVNTDDGAYAHRSNKLLETSNDYSIKGQKQRQSEQNRARECYCLSYSDIRASRGTLSKKNHKNHKQSLPDLEKCLNMLMMISLNILVMMKHHTIKMHQTMVIQNGNSKKRISTGKDGVVRILPPVSVAEIHVVEKERKARTILLMAIPKEHLRRFHGIDDAKEIWEAIRTRFGGNANSKKMQKVVLKQQFEAFTISSSEGLEKGYDMFQQLLSQLEAHGAEVSTEDANHKFLRSLPPAWSNLAMTIRTKPDVDTLFIDDLYNNLRDFE